MTEFLEKGEKRKSNFSIKTNNGAVSSYRRHLLLD